MSEGTYRPANGSVRAVQGSRPQDMPRTPVELSFSMPSPVLPAGFDLDGRYRIENLLAVGGMGQVYRATQQTLGRTVAVKVLRSTLSSGGNAVARFFSEARLVSGLSHPNTVTVFDFGQTQDGLLYMVMEYLDGQSLASVLHAEGRLPLRRALRILAQIADSLSQAHQAGIIHRDLKPSNIVLVERSGRTDVVKVLDFGVAKILEADTSTTLTLDGTVNGTPAYMSPEAVRGGQVGARSDVYSLGVVAYEMLTGGRPYLGEAPFDVMIQHVTAPVPSLPEGTGNAAMERLLARMLAKRPDHRPSSMQQVRLGLAAVAREVMRPKRPVVPAPPRKSSPLAAFDRRSHARRARLVAVEMDDALAPSRAVITDASPGGVFVRTDRSANVGAALALRVAATDLDRSAWVRLDCVVRRVQVPDPSRGVLGGMGLGLRQVASPAGRDALSGALSALFRDLPPAPPDLEDGPFTVALPDFEWRRGVRSDAPEPQPEEAQTPASWNAPIFIRHKNLIVRARLVGLGERSVFVRGLEPGLAAGERVELRVLGAGEQIRKSLEVGARVEHVMSEPDRAHIAVTLALDPETSQGSRQALQRYAERFRVGLAPPPALLALVDGRKEQV